MFRIPEAYLQRPYPGEDRVAGILVMYPDLEPPKETPQQLWDKGEWYKNISFNFRYQKEVKPIEEGIKRSIEFGNLTKKVVDQHGLTYRTYPENSKVRRHEIWVEEDNSSYVRCSLKRKIGDRRYTTPQCIHRWVWKNQHIYASYDKRLLPHWKSIKTNINALLSSFEVEFQQNKEITP